MIPPFPIQEFHNVQRYGLKTTTKITRTIDVASGSLPPFGGIGTGGFNGVYYLNARPGYHQFEIVKLGKIKSENSNTPYTDLMNIIRKGFGRTLTHLPTVFGVSRQTLYNWIAGEIPKEQHREKIIQLAEAAKVFEENGFKPTALMLERTIAKSQSFVELLSQGENGREMAQKLIRIVERGSKAHDKLNALLGEREITRLTVSDMGRQSFPDEG